MITYPQTEYEIETMDRNSMFHFLDDHYGRGKLNSQATDEQLREVVYTQFQCVYQD